MSSKVRSCNKCILDSNDDYQITFDINGICSYCEKFDKDYIFILNKTDEEKNRELNNLIEIIKSEGNGKK